MSLKTGVLPPTTGCEEPHPELLGEAPALRTLRRGELWPSPLPLRASVSAMGFGGINTHLTLEATPGERRRVLSDAERILLGSAQDAAPFLFDAPNVEALLAQVERCLTYAAKLSRSELIDLAAELERHLGKGQARAAVVAASPSGFARRLDALRALIKSGASLCLDVKGGVFLGSGGGPPRIGFLFPGQGTPAHLDGGAWRRRYEYVEEIYARLSCVDLSGGVTTAVAQPAIVASSLAALRVLKRLNIGASVGVGHSLGELTALHWGGALDEETLLRLAEVRGRAMAEHSSPAGAMASINAGQHAVEELLNGDPVVIAGLNSPSQTVISGDALAVAEVVERARLKGLGAMRLPVANAFHSPLMKGAVQPLAAHLSELSLLPLQRAVVSTITGRSLVPGADLRKLLRRQVTAPVRFLNAMSAASRGGCELWIEVGPGQTLHRLAGEVTNTPVVSLDSGGPSLEGLWVATGACFALGAEVDHAALFAGCFTRPFDLDWRPRFLVSPCELAPSPKADAHRAEDRGGQEDAKADAPPATALASSATVEVVRALVSAETELPASAVKDESRLLDDLHLNSITVGQLVAKAARRLALPPPEAPTDYAGATVAEVARALDHIAATHKPAAAQAEYGMPSGVGSWVRPFTVELLERPLPARVEASTKGGWRVLAPADHPLATALERAFGNLEAGGGIVVLLPPSPDESHVGLLLEAARAALGSGEATRFVLVQHGGGAAAFAKTLHLESAIDTCVVDVPLRHPKAVEWVIAEASSASGYREVNYDEEGRRREPFLRPLVLEEGVTELSLTADDVLIVTGGARGITAECALAIGRETGARLALFGLTPPGDDEEIASNLERMAAAGLRFRYLEVDVTDEAAVRRAVAEVEAELGNVTGIIHGAARNVPRALVALDEATFQKTLAPKLRGARNLLASINPERLRLFVTFGSIIARSGLPGEADYGLANEWLTRLTQEWQDAHPDCLCLDVEWSLWSGVGMGARLGDVDAMRRQGINPISPEEGVEAMRRLLGRRLPSAAVVVMGRFREMPTFKVELPELPFLRFLEKPRVFYPRVEFVADAEISTDSDPYLEDHVLGGERLLPAVIGLEAMAQVAMTLLDTDEPPLFEQVEFSRPVLVPTEGALTIRVAALARTPDCVEVCLSSAETGFQVTHFRAMCRLRKPVEKESSPGALSPEASDASRVPLDPDQDLYGNILFHRGRFRRVRGYLCLTATECQAEIGAGAGGEWFSRYLPGRLALGDPGARDAVIHAIQACIPHASILPTGVERISIREITNDGRQFVHAKEVGRDGDTFVYDLEVTGADGRVRESWEGLRLRVLAGATFDGPWCEGLLVPLIERRLAALLPGPPIRVAVERDAASPRRARSDRAMQRALGSPASIQRRPDGKPEVADGRGVSAAHAHDLTLAVAGRGPVGCDVERVERRPREAWHDLLGGERMRLVELIGRETGDDLDAAATRVWNVVECLKKVGANGDASLSLDASERGGWLLISSGPFAACSFVVTMREQGERLGMAVLSKNENAGL